MNIDELWNKYGLVITKSSIGKIGIDKNNFTKAIAEIISQPLEAVVSQENGGQWQTCPKCNGQGCVSRPPWIPGDIVEWAGTTATYPCNVCNGKMIIKY